MILITLILFFIILAFVCFGLLGWMLKGVGVAFEFLWEGCTTSFGCLFWVAIAFFVLMALLL